jgi:hypothetical protein
MTRSEIPGKRGRGGLFWILLGAGVLGLVCLCIVSTLAYLRFSSGFLHQVTFGQAGGYSDTFTVGSQGGEWEGPGGFKLVVPPGALLEEITIQVTLDPGPPAMPTGMTAAGPAFRVDLPAGTQFLAPVEVTLPLNRQAGVSDAAYSAYAWDEVQWSRAGGSVAGDTLQVSLLHFSLYQPGVDQHSSDWEAVLFNHLNDPPGVTDPRVSGVLAWQYTLDNVPFVNSPLMPHRFYLPVHIMGGGYEGKWNAATYPPGSYTLWCVQWTEAAQTGNKMQTYHWFIATDVRPNCKIDDWHIQQCEPPNVPFILPGKGEGVPGACGQGSNDPPMGSPFQPTEAHSPTQTPTEEPNPDFTPFSEADCEGPYYSAPTVAGMNNEYRLYCMYDVSDAMGFVTVEAKGTAIEAEGLFIYYVNESLNNTLSGDKIIVDEPGKYYIVHYSPGSAPITGNYVFNTFEIYNQYFVISISLQVSNDNQYYAESMLEELVTFAKSAVDSHYP